MIGQTVRLSAALWLVGSAVVCGDDSFLGRTPSEWGEQLSSTDGQGRVEAAWAIAQAAGRGQDATFDGVLQTLIKDRDAAVRYWGAMGLAKYAQRVDDKAGGRAVAIEAIQSLLNDKSAAPRIAAAEALGLLGQADKGLPVLIAAMDDPQESVRIQAVAALEKLGPAARPAIGTLQKARADSSEYVKRISDRSLATLGVVTNKAEPKAKAKKNKAKAKSQP